MTKYTIYSENQKHSYEADNVDEAIERFEEDFGIVEAMAIERIFVSSYGDPYEIFDF